MPDDPPRRRTFPSFSSLPERDQIDALRFRLEAVERDCKAISERVDHIDGRILATDAALKANHAEVLDVLGVPPNVSKGKPGTGIAGSFAQFVADSSEYRRGRELKEAIDGAVRDESAIRTALVSARNARWAKFFVAVVSTSGAVLGIARLLGWL